MAYEGPRPVLPGQNTNQWTHNVTGEVGVYSNWQLQSDTHLLDGAPLTDVDPGAGKFPHGVLYSQMFTGTHSYKPMELARYSHGGQDASYLHHAIKEFHGVEGAAVFPSDFGHDGTRTSTYSRFINRGQLKVPSGFELDGGHPFRAYGTGIANHGPTEPYRYQGVGSGTLDNPGETQAAKEGRYGFERVNEHNGVPSSKAL